MWGRGAWFSLAMSHAGVQELALQGERMLRAAEGKGEGENGKNCAWSSVLSVQGRKG